MKIAASGTSVAPPEAEAPVAERMENHQPNAFCKIEGPHPASACGMNRKKAKP